MKRVIIERTIKCKEAIVIEDGRVADYIRHLNEDSEAAQPMLNVIKDILDLDECELTKIDIHEEAV